MTASGGLYPSLGRYFENMTELAHAGCMHRDTVRKCLDGEKDFTRAQKKAISANIAMKLLNSPSYDYKELEDANKAWSGKFDEIYRKKEET
ncbi:MAG: hypothetical protein IKH20_11820 [Clostridiales bacterium]|nr:hypothetical protein [Clostridiales bacterium]